MKIQKLLCLAGALFCLAISGEARADAPDREIIIKFKPGIAENSKSALRTAFKAEELRPAYRDHFRVLRLPDGALRKRILEQLAENPAIEFAEANHQVRAFEINDEFFAEDQWNFQLINVPAAWQSSTGEDVTVAVLDTGVSPWGADGFGTNNRLLPGYNAFLNVQARWQDFHSHGTHVAGTIGQETNNGIGTAGIAYNSRILPVKVLNRFGFGSNATLAAGIRWAVDNGADIINMSLGSSEGGQALHQAIDYAYENNVVVVAASGNDSEYGILMPVSYPAAYEHVIAVGAVDRASERAFYSNCGPELALVAPGGSQQGAILQETFQTYAGFVRFDLGWGYYAMMGTSMASPHVAGVAALVKSQHPQWTPDQIRQALTQTAQDLGDSGRDDLYGHGLVDAAAAVAY